MSYNKFTLAVKSTIDYQANLLAASKGLGFIDIAAPAFELATLETGGPAVIWEFSTIQEDPFDPMWLVAFDIGIMAFADPAQYISLDLISMFLQAFKTASIFNIMDYSGTTPPTQKLGTMFVVSSGVTQHQQDQATGLRFVTVTARCCRDV